MSEETKPRSQPMFKWWSLIAVLLCLVLSFSGALDRWGEDYTASGFKRALATFAVARGLNGVISVAQETELVLQPVGVGVTLAPGQILDPINDLIERFSWVMLAATTSLGLQNLLLDVASWWGFSVLALLAAVWWFWSKRQPDGDGRVGRKVASRVLLLVLMLRFAVPVLALTSELVFDVFLQPRYAESVEKLEQASGQVESLNDSFESATGLKERAKQWLRSAGDNLSVKDKMQAYKEAATQATESAIELIVIFVFQTILLPLFFLWALLRLGRVALASEFR